MKTNILLFLLFVISLVGAIEAQTPITFNTKTDFTTGTNPLFVALGDFNGDGLLDMAVTSQIDSVVSVLLNTTTPGAPTPSFSAKTDFFAGGIPYGVSVGDFNGDGLPDLAVSTTGDTTISVFLNSTLPGASTPSFFTKAEFTTGSGVRGIAIGDLNGDGKPDLIVTNQGTGNVSVLLNKTTPGATTPFFSTRSDFFTGTQAVSVSIGDFNGDGKPDLAIVGLGFNIVAVYLNTTTPGASVPSFSLDTTEFATGTNPSSVYIKDLNGDGLPDLVVSNSSDNNVSVLLNTTVPGASKPIFSARTDFTTGVAPNFVSISDFNSDGKPDLAVVNVNDSSVSVFSNTTTPGAATPTFSSKTDFPTSGNPFSVSTGDFNGDGKPDLAIPGSNNVSVFFNTTNTGTPAVSYSSKTDFNTGSTPNSVFMNDLNGDGKPDLVVTNGTSTSISVFLNTTTPGAASPTFSTKTDFATDFDPVSVSIRDINSDFKPDIVIINHLSDSVSIFLNTTTPGATTPTFSAKTDFPTGTNPSSLYIKDLNGDGLLDLVVSNSSANSISIFFNTTTPGATTPTFSVKTDFPTGTNPRSVSIEDINGDGKPDLIVANNSSNSISVLLNTTTPGASLPTFSTKADYTTGISPNSVSVGDINGDGKPDVVIANSNSKSISVYLNTTTPGATIPTFFAKADFTTGNFPTFISISDLNGDGKLDLAVTNGSSASVSVFVNTTILGASTPTFSAKTDFTTGSTPLSVSIGDLNGDGKPDLAVANVGNNSFSVLLNTIVTGIKEVKNFIPTDFSLKQNYPNPFNPSTIISFSILNESFVTLKIYDVLGKEVAQLVNRQLKTGSYNFSFDAASGTRRLTSGVYFYRLTATGGTNSFVETKKMILLK